MVNTKILFEVWCHIEVTEQLLLTGKGFPFPATIRAYVHRSVPLFPWPIQHRSPRVGVCWDAVGSWY